MAELAAALTDYLRAAPPSGQQPVAQVRDTAPLPTPTASPSGTGPAPVPRKRSAVETDEDEDEAPRRRQAPRRHPRKEQTRRGSRGALGLRGGGGAAVLAAGVVVLVLALRSGSKTPDPVKPGPGEQQPAAGQNKPVGNSPSMAALERYTQGVEAFGRK